MRMWIGIDLLYYYCRSHCSIMLVLPLVVYVWLVHCNVNHNKLCVFQFQFLFQFHCASSQEFQLIVSTIPALTSVFDLHSSTANTVWGWSTQVRTKDLSRFYIVCDSLLRCSFVFFETIVKLDIMHSIFCLPFLENNTQ